MAAAMAAIFGSVQAAPVTWSVAVVDSAQPGDSFSVPAIYAGNVAYTRRADSSSPGTDPGGLYIRLKDSSTPTRLITPGDLLPVTSGTAMVQPESFFELGMNRPTLHAGQLALRLDALIDPTCTTACVGTSGYYGLSVPGVGPTAPRLLMGAQSPLPGGAAGPGGVPSLQGGPIGSFLVFNKDDGVYDALANGQGPIRIAGPGTPTQSHYVWPVTGQPLPVTLTSAFGVYPVVDVEEPAGFPGQVSAVFYASGDLAQPSGGTFPVGGVYQARYAPGLASVAEVKVVADNTTPVPGHGGESFTRGGFYALSPDINNGQVAFYGEGDAGTRGLYLATAGGAISTLADTGTTIPGGIGTFTGFGYHAVSDGRVAFVGRGSAGAVGLYLWQDGVLSKVFDASDFAALFPGETLIDSFYTDEGLGFFHDGFQGASIAFLTESFDTDPGGSILMHHSRVLQATVPEPASPALALLALAGVVAMARRRPATLQSTKRTPFA